MLLLVQRTCITWSKRSRGGALAQVRSRIPTRASVPAPRSGEGWLLHRLDHAEGHEPSPPFGPPRSWTEEGERLPLRLGSDGLQVLEVDGSLEVRNTMGRSPLPPAAGRPARPRAVGAIFLRVSPNSWAGWTENQRHTSMDTGAWWYSETHWCFAWLPQHDPQVFTARAAAQWSDHRSRLR